MACRGRGRVISNLGGVQSEVACPWCEGSGMRVPGIDAQATWRAQREEQDAASQAAGGEDAPSGAPADAPTQ